MIIIQNEQGTVTISEEVLISLAGDAATHCFGVKGMAGKARENGFYQLLRRESMSKGVSISYDGDAISIELHIAVDYGVNLCTIGNSIVNEVSYKVNAATGVPVRQVRVFIDAIIPN